MLPGSGALTSRSWSLAIALTVHPRKARGEDEKIGLYNVTEQESHALEDKFGSKRHTFVGDRAAGVAGAEPADVPPVLEVIAQEELGKG
jgi:hypothetical protein